MNQNAEKWAAALESGEYLQICGHFGFDKYRCALGVAKDVFKKEKGRQLDPDSGEIFQHFDISDGERSQLITLNDYLRKGFPEIAAYIRSQIK